MKGKIVEIEYDAIKNKTICSVACDYNYLHELESLFFMRNKEIDIEFKPIEPTCNCDNGKSYYFVNDIFAEKTVRIFKTPKDEVIFNEPATVLYKDGKKYVCKCDKEDKFSEELGLALCLLKSFGVSYSDFEEILKGAKRQNKDKTLK